MRVLKFGGTSVGSSKVILDVIAILKGYQDKGIRYASVFSAVGGMTNKMVTMSTKAAAKDETYRDIVKEFEEKHIEIVRELISVQRQSTVFAHVKRKLNELEDYLQGVFLLGELTNRTQDAILSYGEQLSTYIVAEAAIERGIKASFVDARQVVKTNSVFGSAKVNFDLTNKNIQDLFAADASTTKFITGFIASNDEGVTTTLGRGGSDYTAAIFGAALDAEITEIWTDVNGVMTADPRKVKNAFTLPSITYSEAMEMSHFGAKVIYPPTLAPLFAKQIPIAIKNTFQPEFEGTLISEKSSEAQLPIKGISTIDDVSLVTVQGSGMVGVTGFSARLFGCLAQSEINIIMITQASSEHSITFAVAPGEGVRAKEVIEKEFEIEIQASRLEPAELILGMAVVAIIGENMSNTPGISGKMFSALGRNGVNVSAIAQGSSEFNVSAVIKREHISKALNALHEEFFLSDARTIHVFMVGPGLIGSTLLDQIKEQNEYLVKNKALNIKVVAIANSKKMFFNEEGIALDTWTDSLENQGENMSFEGFIQKMKDLDLANSVFVDNTSNKDIIRFYNQILDASVSIVTPNKVANSSEFTLYNQLRKTAFKKGVKFLYETNVGAGLPVIGTLQDLINSGDEILKIEGVLSGSLSFIFNTYNGSTTFHEIVLQAKDKGFTEPDPRDDLNGMDVARKILILAREAGMSLEPSDVKVENILPKSCIDAVTVPEFFEQLLKEDAVFQKLSQEANNKGNKLRFIASLENGQVTVGLKEVDAQNPLYNMSGSDNMISFTTKRYQKNPLVIKGPGAGAEVTAAGVFADIIKTLNN